MTDYVDEKVIEGFELSTRQQLAEAMEFAIDQRQNMGESNDEEYRQAAQDALTEITWGLPDVVAASYLKTPLAHPDYAAIRQVFEKLAVRAHLAEAKAVGQEVTLVTRKETYHGTITGVADYEGEECVEVVDDGNTSRIPVVAILRVDEA